MSSEKITKVKIKQGELRGTIENLLSGNTYVSFKGIPYAKPPVGDLRFRAPEPPNDWTGVRDASKHGSTCPQISPYNVPTQMECNEDCLYLNVYTVNVKGPKLPVMVWFHGGAFLTGSGNSDPFGPEYLLEEGVIVVTANYRLEAFGFLSLDTPEIPGNAGMKDQVAVLRWVRDNIENFGGDSGNITIFGESAGGASTTYHIFSPMSEGLFHRVIAQSGCCLNDWTLSDGKKAGLKIAQTLGEHSQDVGELINFFKSLPSKELAGVTVKANTQEEKTRGLKILLSPTVEKSFENQEAFLLKTPLELLSEGKYHKVPVILGYCDKEGIFLTRGVEKTIEKIFESLKTRTPEIIRDSIDKEELEIIEDKIKKYYFQGKNSIDQVLSALEDLESDVSFIYHIVQFSKALSTLSENPVYMYRFSLDGKLNLAKLKKGLDDRKGACHADELGYMFYVSNVNVEEDSVERKTIKRFCKMWANFAKFSNPTPKKDNLIDVIWKPVTKSELTCLSIDCEITNKTDPDKERLEFWDEIYQNLFFLKLIDNNIQK